MFISNYRFAHLALDLEGTLISNAVSQIPRPGLRRFLELCEVMFDEVVVFTTVPEPRFRAIASLLVREGHAPHWLSWISHLHCTDGQKDLRRVPRTGTKAMTILVDDHVDYVVPGQQPQWMPVDQFATPYPDDDVALDRLIPDLAGRVLAWRWEHARTDLVEPKGDPRLSLPKAWAPATLTHTQASDLLALLAGASGLTTNHEDALTLMTHPWSDLGGETFLTLVRSGRTDAAVCHCIGLTVGALG